jgi:hypothetical protein
MPRPPEDDKTLPRLPEDDKTLPRLPEDDSTLAVTSESLVGHDPDPENGELPADTIPVHAVHFPDLDAVDDGQTQRVPFEPEDLGASLDDIEHTILGETQRARPPRPVARPAAPRPAPVVIPRRAPETPAEPPPAPLPSKPALESESLGGHPQTPGVPAAPPTSLLPPTAPSPPTLASPTPIPTPAPSPSSTTGRARGRALPAPTPAWFVGYLVTCAVLTMIGLGVLWFEYRTLGHLLPLWAPGR